MKNNSENPTYTNIEIKKLPKAKIEITGQVKAEAFESFRGAALKNINNEVSIDGFRKGNIPEKILVAKVGEMPILEEMAELALSAAYPAIVLDKKIDAIGRPEIKITKIAANNPLEFNITTAVVPEITLADYKKISKEENKKSDEKITDISKVTDAEVEEAITKIRRSHAERSDAHRHVHEEQAKSGTEISKEEHEKLVDAAMPTLDDAFVQSLGSFKDVADFKEKVKIALLKDKAEQAKEKRRIAISEKISDATTVEIPDVLVNSELQRIDAQFRDDVARMGISFDDYLKHAKKTIEDIKKEWMPFAEKKAKLQLILNKISELENIKAEPAEIEEEVEHILAHYKDADREHAYVYAESVLTNEKIFQYLESLK